MPFPALSDFLEELIAAGELVRVSAPVDPDQEVAEITARCAAAGGPALLFDHVQGHELPVITNLLGTEQRACRALAVPSLAALAERLSQLARSGGGQSWLDRLRGGGDALPIEKFRPKPARQAACHQAVRLGRDIDLTTLPALRCWPGESGRSLTGRLLMADQDNQSTRVRQARGLIVDRKHLAFVAAELMDRTSTSHEASGETSPRPASFVLGGDPAGTIAAALDWVDLDGFVLAGLLRNQPWEVVPARSQPLSIPADAELVIEGLLHAGAQPGRTQFTTGSETAAGSSAAIGSQGSSLPSPIAVTLAHGASGHYADPQDAPWLFEVSAITHRVNPVLPLLLAGDLAGGSALGEIAVLHAVRSTLLRPMLSAAIPELVDCSLPVVGGPTGFVVLAIRKTYAGQARRAVHALWGLPAFEHMKCVLVVDADVDVHQPGEVIGRIAANVSPERDLFCQTGPGPIDDHAAAQPGIGEHLGIDATAKVQPEHPRPWPARLERPPQLREAVARRWSEYGLPQF